MAEDARALLQSQRNARKIKHPYASYASTGKLLCNICNSFVKSDNLWESHLRSHQHLHRLKQSRSVRAVNAEAENRAAPKKRKAEGDGTQESKRTRSETLDQLNAPQKSLPNEHEVEVPSNDEKEEVLRERVETVVDKRSMFDTSNNAVPKVAVDETEWDAFERDMAELGKPEARQPAISALEAAPTISAAPLSAKELAARAREELSTEKNPRASEIEEEKEDASRQMDEEVGRMAELEEKMKKWRERREAMRNAQKTEADGNVERGSASERSEADDDREESSEDDFDEWGGFGGSVG